VILTLFENLSPDMLKSYLYFRNYSYFSNHIDNPMKNLILFLTLFVTACQKTSDNPHICIYTTSGNIYAELYPDKAPVSSSNFMGYVKNKLYDSSFFYRTVKMNNQPHNTIKIEVIQGGFESDSSPKMLPAINHENTLETGILHKNGTLSMARNDTGTATSEFFICIGDQTELDFGGKRNPDGQGFAAFGKVIKGMDVVGKVHEMPDTNQYMVNPVIIDSIRLVRSLD
jgi:peptidyl-prolyl cis-trans isomerase A (cyclophilin A)